jgi:methyl-accepting chemotaxis protein
MMTGLKLKTKLLASFLLVAFIAMAIGLVGIFKITQINDADTILYKNGTVALGNVGTVAAAFQRIRLNVLDAVVTTDEAEKKHADETIQTLETEITTNLDAYEKTIATDDGRKLFNELKEARARYTAFYTQALALDAKGNDQEALRLLTGEGRKISNDYQKLITDLVNRKIDNSRQISEGNDAQAKNAARFMYAFVAIGFLASIGLGFALTSSVMSQLGEDPGYLFEVSSKIAGGDLDVVFRPQEKEGGVYHVMQGMVATMKEKIKEADQKSAEAAEQARLAGIATDEANEAKAKAERAKAEGMIAAAHQLEKVVEVVSSASEELSAQVEQSSRGTEVQSTRVAETATAMEEMNATVLEVAKNASQAADSSASARTKAVEGAKIVSLVVNGISTMQNVSLTMKEDMHALGNQAEGIGQVMNVISDIADQTNLLALNAAIEAARAGDAGRGFAVVADEVRKLAEKTMTATKEVGEAISGIQHGTKKNLENVERAVATVEEATALAHQSGDALQEIVRLVEVSTDQVRSIAAASEEQSSASEEINKSIEEINRISSETASAMNQSAQAVGELANQAGQLRTLIEQMKTGA